MLSWQVSILRFSTVERSFSFQSQSALDRFSWNNFHPAMLAWQRWYDDIRGFNVWWSMKKTDREILWHTHVCGWFTPCFCTHHTMCIFLQIVHFVNPHMFCIRTDNSNLRQKVQWFLTYIIRSWRFSHLRTLKLSSYSSSSVIQLWPLAMVLSPILCSPFSLP